MEAPRRSLVVCLLILPTMWVLCSGQANQDVTIAATGTPATNGSQVVLTCNSSPMVAGSLSYRWERMVDSATSGSGSSGFSSSGAGSGSFSASGSSSASGSGSSSGSGGGGFSSSGAGSGSFSASGSSSVSGSGSSSGSGGGGFSSSGAGSGAFSASGSSSASGSGSSSGSGGGGFSSSGAGSGAFSASGSSSASGSGSSSGSGGGGFSSSGAGSFSASGSTSVSGSGSSSGSDEVVCEIGESYGDIYEVVGCEQTLEFMPIVFGDEGIYRCIVSTDDIEFSSSPYTLYISPEGSVGVVIDPSQNIYDEGDDLVLTCSAMGGPSNTFEWQLNDVTLAGETDSILNRTNIAANEDGGTYTCVVSNDAGSGMDSATVNVMLVITENPTSFSTSVSQNQQFVCNATGFPEPTFQWFKEGGNLTGNFSGEDTSVLRFTPVQFGDEGDYYCQVTSGNTILNSSVVTLGVSSQGTVVINPANESFDIGQDVNLNCSAMGGPRNMFQWLKDGIELPGENSTILALTSIAVDDGGEYTCEVSNFAGTFNTSVFVFINPRITLNPSDANVTNGTDVELNCQAESFPVPTYEWTYSNGSSIAIESVLGIGDDQLQFRPAEFGSEGSYVCSATANNMTVTSLAATLYISPGGGVSVTLSNTAVGVGDDVNLTCSAQGGPNNTFTWEHEGTLLNVTDTSFTVSNITISDGGEYTCIARNVAGSGRASATVNILPRILTPPEDVFTTNGSSIAFMCEAEGFPTPNVTWQRVQMGIATVSLDRVYNITPVVFGDEGNYLCVATSFEEVSEPATLTISPEGSVQASPRDVSSERNQTYTFDCTAMGGPNNAFSWTRLLDDQVVSGTSDLTVVVDDADNGGDYRCTVQNAAGNDTDDITLRVEVVIDTQPQTANVSRGSNFSLSCTASAYPLPDISWLHNASAVIEDSRISISETNTARSVTSTITIENAIATDSGDYVCRVGAPPGTEFNTTDSDTALVLVQDIPDRPREVQGVNVTSRNLTLQWLEPDDSNAPILGYRVSYRRPAFLNTTGTVVLETTATSLDIIGLHPGTTYNFTVVAFNDIGDSLPSDVAAVRTLDEVPVGFPRNIRALTTTSTDILVQWDPVPPIERNGDITHYEIELNQSTLMEVAASELRSTSGAQLMLLLTGLQEFVEYTVRVRAYTSAGNGPFSPSASNTTLTDRPSASPQNVNAIADSSTAIRVSWEEVPTIDRNGEITIYEVQYEPLETFGGQIATSTANTSMLFILLTDLQEFVDYNISVRAYTSAGPGPYSDGVIERTDTDEPAEPPENVTTMVESSTEIQVSWEEVPAIDQNGEIITYEVQYEPVQTFNGQISTAIMNTSMLSINLTGLQEFVDYNISVRAYTSAGPGPYSDPVTERTLEDEPASPPGGVVATSLSSSSVRVNWTQVPPIDQNGIITQYEVEYNQTTFSGVPMYNTTITPANPTMFTEVLSDLLEFVEYTIRVRAYTRVGPGPYSNVVSVTTDEDVPDSPPVNVAANSTSPTEIQVTWDPVPPIDQNGVITQYEVEYTQSTFASVPMTQTVIVNSTMALLIGLEEFVEYSIRVRAYTSVGAGPYSDAVVERTREDGPAFPPNNVTATATSSTSIQVNWEEVPAIDQNGVITQYEVEYTQSTFASVPMTQTITVTSTMTALIGLEEFVEYSIRVRAYTSVGPGPYSDAVMETTDEDTPASPPNNVTATTTSSTSIQVNWEEVPAIDQNGVITQYEVEYTQSTFASVPMTQTVTVASTMAALTGLEEFVEYSIRVRAYTSVGPGPYSDAVMETTDEDTPASPPNNVTANATSSTSIQVNWEEVPAIDQNGVITQYEVEYTQSTFASVPMTQTVTVTSTMAALIGLEEFVEYSIRVRAYTSVGPGPYSDAVMETTDEDTPASPPNNVTATTTSSTAIQVNWEEVPAIDQNGVITQYEVEYTQSTFASVPMTQTVTVAPTMAALTGLEEFVEYSIRVRAYTSVGPGPYTDAVMERTDDDVPASPPSDLFAMNLSSTLIGVIWMRVSPIDQNGVITQYEVEYNQSTFSEAVMYNTTRVDNTTFEVDLNGLEEFVEYSIRVRAYTRVGPGPYSDPMDVLTNQDEPSAAPVNLEVVNVSANALAASWERPSEIDINGILTAYAIYYQIEGNSSSLQSVMVSGETLSTTLNDLNNYTTYIVSVFAVTIGMGPNVSQSERTSENVPGEAPLNVAAVNSSSTSVLVSWQPPTPELTFGILRAFVIRYSLTTQPGDYIFIQDIITAEQTMFNIMGLNKFANYSVEVSAVTIGSGPFSSPVYVVTDEDIPGDVSQPPVVDPADISTISALARWEKPDEPNGNIIRYAIRYEAVSMATGSGMQQGRRRRQAGNAIVPECILGGSENIDRTETVDGTQTSITLQDLTPYLTYEFSVQAETRVGKGNFSVPRRFETDEFVPTAPRNLTVRYLSSMSLEATWDPPECDYGVRIGYTLVHTALPSPDPQGTLASNIPSLTPDTSRIVLEGLSPNTNYNLTLCTRTSTGCGNTITSINQTDEDAPMRITELDITSSRISGSDREVRLDISWIPPSTRNGTFRTLFTFTGSQTPDYPSPRSNSVGPMIQTLGENDDSFVIIGGLPYAEYTITVQPFNVKTGNLATPVTMTQRTIAIEPTVVENLRADGVSPTSIRVSWDLPLFPNAPITDYIVYYSKISDDTDRIESDPEAEKQDPSNIVVDGYSQQTVTTNVTTIEGLDEYRYYSIIVSAVGEADSEAKLNGALREVVNRTFSDLPTVPPDVVVPSGDSQNTITISLPEHGYIDTGEVIFYALIVIKGTLPNNKQSDYDGAMAYVPGAPYYITAAWAGVNITLVPITYIIGNELISYADGVKYLNAKLDAGSDYTFFVRIDLQSDIPGEVHRIRTNFTTASTDDVPTSVAGAAAGAVIAILVVIIIVVAVVVILFCVRRRHRFKQLDIVAGEVAMDDLASSINPVMPISSQIFANPLASPHRGTFEPISVRDFPEHVQHLHSNDDFLFTEEYGSVEPDHAPSSEVCMRPENQSRNRYANIRAYDHSRIKLTELPNEIGSDYINANRLDGYRQPNAFIATQGPVPSSIPDFWRMVWEQSSATIVMLTNLEEKGRLKCHKYWPDEAERTKVFDSIRVSFQESLVLAEYTIRTFSLQMDGSKEERIVKQFHYTVWPDHGVPEYPTPLLQFVRKVAASSPMNAGPIVVHCSAGVGRTGTFITLDAQLKKIKAEQAIDIFGFVRSMRKRRCYMVQTEPQYIFLHDSLLEAIECGVTEVAARDLQDQYEQLIQEDPVSRKSQLERMFRMVQSTLHGRQVKTFSTLPVNRSKNRYTDRDMLPFDKNRCRLRSIPGAQGSDYINASYIDGYHRIREFIATQGPLPDTENDFWRMIWEQKCSTIIMLTKERDDDGKVKCHTYWPKSGAGQYDYLQVILHSTSNYPDYTLREFKLVDTRDESSLPVKQFQYTDWPEESVPAAGSGLIDLIGQVQKWQTRSGDRPVVVHCSGGCGRTGTYIAVSILIERLKTEGAVDVFQTVRKLRLQRPGMVSSVEQYRFCYKTLLEFLDSFELYANFK